MSANDVPRLLAAAEIDQIVDKVVGTQALENRKVLFANMYAYRQNLPKLDDARPREQTRSDLDEMNEDFRPLEEGIVPLERWLLNALDQIRMQQVLSAFFQNKIQQVQVSWRRQEQQATNQRRENFRKVTFQPPSYYVSLIDRVDQVEEFTKKWSFGTETDVARTYVVIIDGQHGDGHDYLRDRLVRIHLVEALTYPAGEQIPIIAIDESMLRADDLGKKMEPVFNTQLLPDVSRLRSYPLFAIEFNLTRKLDARRIADAILQIPTLAKAALSFPISTVAFIKFYRGDSLLDRYSDWRCSQRFQEELQRVTQQGHRDIWLTKLSLVEKGDVNDWGLHQKVSSLGLPLRTWTDIKDFFLNNKPQRFEPFARQVESVLEKYMFSTS